MKIRLSLVVLIPFLFLLVALRTASAAEQGAATPALETEADADARTRGLRFQAGVFALTHIKRGPGSSINAAPNFTIGASYRYRSWEFEAIGRGTFFDRTTDRDPPPPSRAPTAEERAAYGLDDIDLNYDPSHDHYRTVFGSLGLGARWFASPSSSWLSGFVSTHVEYMGFWYERRSVGTDTVDGDGLALRVGGGLELWHCDAHHRLALEVSALFPTFNFAHAHRPSMYLVPISLGARWTF